VVLVTIVMTIMLIKTLGQASRGVVNPSEVMLVMGYTVLGQSPTILTLSLFIAATATLTRMYATSEMVVWFSCGQGLGSFLRPLLQFAWPVLVVIALLALVLYPFVWLLLLPFRLLGFAVEGGNLPMPCAPIWFGGDGDTGLHGRYHFR